MPTGSVRIDVASVMNVTGGVVAGVADVGAAVVCVMRAGGSASTRAVLRATGIHPPGDGREYDHDHSEYEAEPEQFGRSDHVSCFLP